MALDWGIARAERYDPQIIGASFRMSVATARTFARPRTEVWNHVYCLATRQVQARMATARR
jgi:hypothetical protein